MFNLKIIRFLQESILFVVTNLCKFWILGKVSNLASRDVLKKKLHCPAHKDRIYKIFFRFIYFTTTFTRYSESSGRKTGEFHLCAAERTIMIHEQTLNCLKSFCLTLVKRSSVDTGILLNSKKLVIPWIMKSSNILKSSAVRYSRNISFHINCLIDEF